jgi:putrescine transport system permease protein
MRRGASWFNVTAITLGFAFLYLPIVLLVVYSFNASKLVTVWGGFSTKWYVSLLSNQGLLDAAWVTIRVALLSATLATILGTMAAIALVRFGRFPGGTLFSGMVYAPLVMPEVITGLAMLLLFVAIGFARGFWTLTLAHITFSMCFVAVVVQSRLVTFDRSLEEAALDLGCPPLRTFFTITLPLILPAVVAGWMLAFTLSLDDLVISSFTTGPGATTLPMKIYSQVRLGVTPEINAICTILIAIVATGVIIASIVTKREIGGDVEAVERKGTMRHGVQRKEIRLRGLAAHGLRIEARQRAGFRAKTDVAGHVSRPRFPDRKAGAHGEVERSGRKRQRTLQIEPLDQTGKVGAPDRHLQLAATIEVAAGGFDMCRQCAALELAVADVEPRLVAGHDDAGADIGQPEGRQIGLFRREPEIEIQRLQRSTLGRSIVFAGDKPNHEGVEQRLEIDLVEGERSPELRPLARRKGNIHRAAGAGAVHAEADIVEAEAVGGRHHVAVDVERLQRRDIGQRSSRPCQQGRQIRDAHRHAALQVEQVGDVRHAIKFRRHQLRGQRSL